MVGGESQEWKPVENTPVILFDRVSKSYGKINAMGGVSLAISGGVTGILGMNGAGKSTLFKLMMGKIRQFRSDTTLWNRPFGKNPALILELALFPNTKNFMIG